MTEQQLKQKQAIVVHSGGMDSSLCLALAVKEFGAQHVLAMSFRYGQRHSVELEQAKKICQHFEVDRVELNIDCLNAITCNSLMSDGAEISSADNGEPNTLVVGRNGLMGRLAAIHADHLGAQCIYMGVIEVESANSGYRDCSRDYMDRLQDLLRDDLANPNFSIRTPLVKMTKAETMQLGYDLGELAYLLDMTVTCYRGLPHIGCQACPACDLRNQGILEFSQTHPDFALPYSVV
jgi:7-cyano-7-deazaguanine synthase